MWKLELRGDRTPSQAGTTLKDGRLLRCLVVCSRLVQFPLQLQQLPQLVSVRRLGRRVALTCFP